MGILTVEQLSDEIRAGKLMEHAVGEEVTLRHAVYGEMPFVIIGRNQETLSREHGAHATIRSKYAFERRPFDLPTLEHRYGSNNYRSSFIARWLEDVFWPNIDPAQGSRTAYVRKKCGKNEIVTRAFLLSASELGFTGARIADEGAPYELYSGDLDESRQVCYPDGDGAFCWTRSPIPWSAGYVRIVIPDGSLNSNVACGGFGAAAACVVF